MNAASDAPAYVRRDERVLWKGKPTLLVLISNTVGFAFFVLIGGLFSAGSLASDAPTLAAILPFVVLIIFGVILTLNAMRLRRTEYVITDQSIYTRTGLIGQSVIQTTYDKITDIALRQDVLGRIFGYSTLQVNTAGSNTAPVQMSGLQRALEVKQRIEQTRDTLLQRDRGVEPAPAWEALPTALPRFTLDKDIIRISCTTTKKPFKRPRTDLGKRIACPHCGQNHIIKEASRGRSA